MVLMKTFGPKSDEKIGDLRKFHNIELRDLCSLQNIISLIESRRIRWTRHGACIDVDTVQ